MLSPCHPESSHEGQEFREGLLKVFFSPFNRVRLLSPRMQSAGIPFAAVFLSMKLHLTRFRYQQLIKSEVANYVHSPLKTLKASFSAKV